jgi:hypothetical protein
MFLIYVIRRSNDHGTARGIYYLDACEACRMSIQTFYDVLDTLTQKGIITYTRVKDDYDITVFNNDFSYEGACNEGYINVSREIFDGEAFRKLKAKAKLLLLIFMRNTLQGKCTYEIGINNFYKVYMELLGVTKDILRMYLHTLKQFFNIHRQDGKYFVKVLKGKMKKLVVAETDQFRSHAVDVDSRRSGIREVDEIAKKEIMILYQQYGKYAKNYGVDIILLIGECINKSVKEIKNKLLNYKYIHKLVKERLSIA